MKLGIVYHMPFWRGEDGSLREIEGSFARYVDSLAPYFDEISLCVPVLGSPRGEGTAIRSANVTLAALPAFDGPIHFYPKLLLMLPRLARWVRHIDLLHCRIPSPAAIFAFAFARWLRRPAFVLVVGDLEALLPSMPYRGMKRLLWWIYTRFEEWNVQTMVNGSAAFANGAALAVKHARPDHPVVETRTTTISGSDIGERDDTCVNRPIRILTVSRIDPRKGLQVLPETLRLLTDSGVHVTWDLVGPTVGRPGDDEREQLLRNAGAFSVSERLTLLGPVPLNRLLPMYRDYDLFVLPTLPGEGIPRVLLEAMTSGLPVVTTRVAGIPSLVTHEHNGLLVDAATPAAVAAAIQRIVQDEALRRSLIARGYETARGLTLEVQAAKMMKSVSQQLHLTLRGPAVAQAV